MTTEPTTAAGYLRVSTPDQAADDRYGLTAQRADIEAAARREGARIVAWYADEGVSGAVLEREGLTAALEAARRGEIEELIVGRMDRLARDLFAQLWFEKEFLAAGCAIYSATEPLRGQDPMTRLHRQILGAFSEFERHRITERLSSGRKHKARAGGYAGGKAPLGYRAERGDKALEIDQEGAEAVKRIFALARRRERGRRLSLRRIAQILNGEGHRTATGKEFAAMTVKRVLDRKEFYRGIYRYAGEEASGWHEAIIK